MVILTLIRTKIKTLAFRLFSSVTMMMFSMMMLFRKRDFPRYSDATQSQNLNVPKLCPGQDPIGKNSKKVGIYIHVFCCSTEVVS